MGVSNLLNGGAGLARDYVAYPLLAAVVPGEYQPSFFRHLPGALKQQKQPYQLEELLSGTTANPELAPESLAEHAAYEAACRYSARSGALEILAGTGVFFGNVIHVALTGDGLSAYGTAFGFGFGIYDGWMRLILASAHHEPSCIGQGVLMVFGGFSREAIKEGASYIEEGFPQRRT